jgi:hypothetical protein
MNKRKDNLPITRSHLAEISRAFNRSFPYIPVTIIFRYGAFLFTEICAVVIADYRKIKVLPEVGRIVCRRA